VLHVCIITQFDDETMNHLPGSQPALQTGQETNQSNLVWKHTIRHHGVEHVNIIASPKKQFCTTYPATMTVHGNEHAAHEPVPGKRKRHRIAMRSPLEGRLMHRRAGREHDRVGVMVWCDARARISLYRMRASAAESGT
jgi:hypothetical protein